MIKPPYSYLFYSILAFLLFSWGCYNIFILQTRQVLFGLLVLLLPLILSIVFLILFFVKKKEVKKTVTKKKPKKR